jgi:hypothetical protein
VQFFMLRICPQMCQGVLPRLPRSLESLEAAKFVLRFDPR